MKKMGAQSRTATGAQRRSLKRDLRDMSRALEVDDTSTFNAIALRLATGREQANKAELHRLTLDLQAALDDFRNNSRLASLTAHEVPDAKLRLQQVLKLTDDAAHRTLDLVEQSQPIADRIGKQARALVAQAAEPLTDSVVIEFVREADTAMASLRTNLSEVLTAQSYQDLSGQILRNVMKLVDEIESALARLLLLARDPREVAAPAVDLTRGAGPAVPGIATGKVVGAQQDVDDLLSGLGL